MMIELVTATRVGARAFDRDPHARKIFRENPGTDLAQVLFYPLVI